PGASSNASMPVQSARCRSSVSMPSAPARATLSGLSSQAITRAPPTCSALDVARPEPPRPKTATVFPLKEVAEIIPVPSPELQRRKPDQRQKHGDDPEADDHLAFRPAQLFEMMMDGGHEKDPLAGHIEHGHLDDDRENLDDEKAADNGEHDLVLGRHGDRAEQTAERERPGIAHEDGRGRRIEPEEAEARADHGAQHYGKLPGARHEMDLQVISEDG